MTLIKPHTFVAGTKAKSSEVNENFDAVYGQVNTNMTDIISLQDTVDNMEDTKAELNGDNAERFLMAEPVNNYDGVNKLYLSKYSTNTKQLITGLYISKSTDDTILVTAGSCLDSTFAKQLELTSNTSKQNATQSASTTYYVYIIAKTSTTIFGTEIDLLISTSSSTPPLPTDYIYYRQIGTYITDSSNKISYTTSINPTSYSKQDLTTAPFPDYSNGVTKSLNTVYYAEQDGWIYSDVTLDASRQVSIQIGLTSSLGTTIAKQGLDSAIGDYGMMLPLQKNYYYKVVTNGAYGGQAIWYPCKGV